MSARHKRRALHAGHIIACLAELWPRAFAVYQPQRRPLKIGIDKDIIAAAGAAIAAGSLTVAELKLALAIYCGNINYLRKLHESAERIDLDGEIAGHVTRHEAEIAVARRFARSKPIAIQLRNTTRKQENGASTKAPLSKPKEDFAIHAAYAEPSRPASRL